MKRKEREETVKEECFFCRSFSGPKNGFGWCMKRRMPTRSNKWCGLWGK